MHTSGGPYAPSPDINALHVVFLALLPRIQLFALTRFRHVKCAEGAYPKSA
jgi:hypothetical protein